MKRLFPVLFVLALAGCINTEKMDAANKAVDTGLSVLNTVKKVLTFPIDIFTPAPPAPEEKVEVPGGLPTWIGSTVSALVAGFVAGRLRKKETPGVKP